jgi:hypothetical protein
VDKEKRFEFKTDPENGMLVGPDGCHYDTEAEAMFYSRYAACGCGCPETIHKLLVDCAKQFDGDWPKPGVEGIEKIVRERPDIVAEFIGHYLNADGLAEHGSSVYGSWLTERGEQFIEVGTMPQMDRSTGA